MTTSVEVRPEVKFDRGRNGLVDAYRHEDGSITYVVYDDGYDTESPRSYDGNVATLIQENDRCLDCDDDDAGLRQARDRFSGYGCYGTTAPTWGRGERSPHYREYMMRRYLAMFRPDILHYVDWWGAGRESYGWGYITREAWEKQMYPERPSAETPEAVDAWLNYEPSVTPKEVFDQEVELYRQWAEGEVYGGIHVSVGKPIVQYGPEGAYVDEYEEEEDSCWGFLGYDDHKEICWHFTDSPITEVLY